MTASLCVSICLALSLHPSTFSVTGARSLPPSRSSCPCSLTVSSLTAGWREADARVYLGAQAPASTTLLFCSALWREGLEALKAQCTLQLACTLPRYLFSRRLSRLCHSSIKGVISLLNHHEVFLCRQLSRLRGTSVQKSLCFSNVQIQSCSLMTSSDWNWEGRPTLILLPTILFVSILP